jgi:hypothetical protein
VVAVRLGSLPGLSIQKRSDSRTTNLYGVGTTGIVGGCGIMTFHGRRPTDKVYPAHLRRNKWYCRPN